MHVELNCDICGDCMTVDVADVAQVEFIVELRVRTHPAHKRGERAVYMAANGRAPQFGDDDLDFPTTGNDGDDDELPG